MLGMKIVRSVKFVTEGMIEYFETGFINERLKLIKFMQIRYEILK